MKHLLTYCFFFLAISAWNKSIAQNLDYSASKEKIYIQTNHVFFKPGETIYFKIYLVNAQDQTPSDQSMVVYAEVINPSGNVMQKMNYQVVDGYAEGSYDFDEKASGGIYKIRAYTTWMRNEKDSTFFVKEITLQKVIAPRVLMKLDFRKKAYGAGDEVVADYSVRNLSDQPVKNYAAKYTVSIGGTVVQTNSFKTNNEGKSEVKFNLPGKLETNDGLLNITIQYDSYTEAISRSIPIVLNKIDLQFMPEGGTIIEGIPANIAFKALNENGKAADIKGEVVDQHGNKVASFESYHFGMGQFSFTPQTGYSYTAKIISPIGISQQFDLPNANGYGIVMNISKKDNKVLVKLNSTEDRNIELVGQTKNVSHYIHKIALRKGQQLIEVDENLFPAGIARFTVYNVGNLPVAERIIFLNENKVLQVKISTDKEKYLPREKVKMTLETVDENGVPIPSNFSLSVVDDKLWTFADDKQEHILSWLLMSSELHGKIEEPQFYFKKEEVKSLPALDLVMLTHGYRYFEYIEYVQREGRLKYTPDQGNILSGVVLNENQLPVKANVFLIDSYGNGKALNIQTSADGVFFFSELTPGVNYHLVAQSLQSKEKVNIQIQQNGIGYNPLRVSELPQLASGYRDFKGPMVSVDREVIKKEDDRRGPANIDIAGLQMQQNALSEVVVIGFGSVQRRDLAYSTTIVRGSDLMPMNSLETALQGKVAGVNINNSGTVGSAANIRLRGTRSLIGGSEPLIILNGSPVENIDRELNPGDIESVTVLKDASATALYGSRAADGVIIIESSKSKNERINFDLTRQYYYATQFVPGSNALYSEARKFYTPRYSSLDVKERNDFRETIYWNPVVQTNNQGTATIEFYNSDASTTFRAIAEGIGYNGKLGRTEKTYAVQNAMSVDAKIPPYLTVGDKALIPLVIKNNTTQMQEVNISLNLPQRVKAGNYIKAIDIEAGDSKQILIPVEASAPVNASIQFIVEGQFNKETISLPIVAAEKGFPVIKTISGNNSASHTFDVSKMIPGSLKSELKLFTSLEGQLLDGIESMLREPYGCFEQTSSMTYPNIYVLKYLKQSGKSNPGIEKKALGYIEAGYKRLIGFETSEDGFEWFGKAPAHEALTAYGLLEFTDMKEFVKVDERMLARTKNFLMRKRDGKGSFTITIGGYDRFASVPNKIANIYIVYALTQAGIGKEIQLEYETAVKKAIESNDGYLLAMMALAASNMKNEKDFSLLMSKLNTSYLETGLKSETSVVSSRDASLKVEVLSLYALALAREKNPKVGVMAELISKVLAGKSYYGYGSTQSTVLALQAIIEYSKLTDKLAAETKVDFTLNKKAIIPGKSPETTIKEGENSFAILYSNDKKTIPYNLEVSYYTFTPPNSEKAELKLSTRLKNLSAKVGETIRMEIEVKNEKSILQPMAIAKIGIPAGLSAQPWQLKELIEKKEVAYYEIFDNYLVLYWMGFGVNETKKINLDLKAEVPGKYKGKASTTYLYYTPEYKHWNDGVEVEVMQ